MLVYEAFSLPLQLVALIVLSVTQVAVHPSVYAASTRPWPSTVISLKSSILRHGLLPPDIQTHPRWTGSFGVALTVVHVLPRSYVNAT